MKNLTNDDFFSAGNFMISIGHSDIREVALFSKSSGRFVKLNKQNLKRSKTLRRVKTRFSSWLNARDTFTFSFMTPDLINELIDLLKSKQQLNQIQ